MHMSLFFESVFVYCKIKFVTWQFLRRETIVEWVLREAYKRKYLNLFCHFESVREIENKILKYIV